MADKPKWVLDTSTFTHLCRAGHEEVLAQLAPGGVVVIPDDVNSEIEKGRDAAALVAAGAIDGLSIGYRTVTAEKDAKGQRLLREVELWEVSLVTFPMLPEARVSAKGETLGAETLRDLAALFEEARRTLAGR